MKYGTQTICIITLMICCDLFAQPTAPEGQK